MRYYFSMAMLLLALSGVAAAQRRSDPLTDPETDQLRDAAQEPDVRLKLYVTFARARLAALEAVRSDAKVTDKPAAIHERLQAFVDVYDEMNQNIDSFNARKEDLRKVLKIIIDADTEFQARLRAIKDSAEASKNDAKVYEFVLSDAVDDVDTSIADHRQLLDAQEELAKQKKLLKH